jgi:hypothetical protein
VAFFLSLLAGGAFSLTCDSVLSVPRPWFFLQRSVVLYCAYTSLIIVFYSANAAPDVVRCLRRNTIHSVCASENDAIGMR